MQTQTYATIVSTEEEVHALAPRNYLIGVILSLAALLFCVIVIVGVVWLASETADGNFEVGATNGTTKGE